MKNCLLAMIILCGAIHAAEAQRIRFTDTSNSWQVTNYNIDGFFVSSMAESYRYVSDTVIAGMTYQRILRFSRGTFSTRHAFREDTVTNKIYFRFLTTSDSLEHLFFDYNLRRNDTLKMDYGSMHSRHYVTALDSVTINGLYYKRWKMFPASGSTAASPYTFIEGIGSINRPDWPIYNWVFEDIFQLRCFINRSIQPACTPASELPYAKGHVDLGVFPADSFDNVTSCTFRSVGVENPVLAAQVAVVPNPASSADIMLQIPARIATGLFQVRNMDGRLICSFSVRQTKTSIRQYLSTPGVYYYTLQDAATGQRYSGRFIFH